MIGYKLLRADGSSLREEWRVHYPLPTDSKPGDWIDVPKAMPWRRAMSRTVSPGLSLAKVPTSRLPLGSTNPSPASPLRAPWWTTGRPSA